MTTVLKLPQGKPPNLNNPDKCLWYLRLKAQIDGLNPDMVKVPGLEGHPEDGTVEYPGDLTEKQVLHFNSGRKSAYDVSNMYSKTSTMTPTPAKVLSDNEVIEQIQGRFQTLQVISKGACEGDVRSVIVSGKGGVGKTYSITRIIDHYKEKYGIKAEVHSGIVSPIQLYMMLYRNKGKGQITVLDDADNIFSDNDALTLLKAALDTSPIRKLSWLTNSPTLKNEGIENEFIYEGSMIFITNLNFREKIKAGRGPLVAHLQALMTRAMYLDLKLHSQRELILWISHMIKKNHILVQEGLDHEQEMDVLNFMLDNQNNFDSLSIRSAVLLSQCVKMDPENWRALAMDLCMND